MFINSAKRVIFLTVLVVAATSLGISQADTAHLQVPAVPCSEIVVPEGHKLQKIVYAVGVQIYRWNGSAWVFVAPEANLYADPNYRGKVGTHYGGPTWEANNGGKVVAARVNGCSPDPESVAWLLLQAVDNEGPGVFGKTTYIQRINTVQASLRSVPECSWAKRFGCRTRPSTTFTGDRDGAGTAIVSVRRAAALLAVSKARATRI